MKKHYLIAPVRIVLVAAVLVGLLYANGYSGIRMDGTEFQSGSEKTSVTITAQSGRSTIPTTRLAFTFGQAVLAKGVITNAATGTAVKIGLGYDFNLQNTTAWGCTCPNQGSLTADGFEDSQDVEGTIQALFFNGDNPQDPLCPTFRIDLNCDGYITASDLSYMIDLVYYNGTVPCQPCAAD